MSQKTKMLLLLYGVLSTLLFIGCNQDTTGPSEVPATQPAPEPAFATPTQPLVPPTPAPTSKWYIGGAHLEGRTVRGYIKNLTDKRQPASLCVFNGLGLHGTLVGRDESYVDGNGGSSHFEWTAPEGFNLRCIQADVIAATCDTNISPDIFAGAYMDGSGCAPTPEPSPSPTPQPSPTPTPQPSPTPTPEPSPSPSPEPLTCESFKLVDTLSLATGPEVQETPTQWTFVDIPTQVDGPWPFAYTFAPVFPQTYERPAYGDSPRRVIFEWRAYYIPGTTRLHCPMELTAVFSIPPQEAPSCGLGSGPGLNGEPFCARPSEYDECEEYGLSLSYTDISQPPSIVWPAAVAARLAIVKDGRGQCPQGSNAYRLYQNVVVGQSLMTPGINANGQYQNISHVTFCGCAR